MQPEKNNSAGSSSATRIRVGALDRAIVLIREAANCLDRAQRYGWANEAIKLANRIEAGR